MGDCPTRLGFNRFRKSDETLGGIRTAVEDHVFDQAEKVLGDILIDAELSCIHDTHVETSADGMIEENGMHRFANVVVATERKRNVADAAAHAGVGEIRFDPPRGFNKSDRVFVMLLNACGDRKNIRVKNDILWRESDLVNKSAVGALTNFGFSFERVGLTLLVKRHHDRGRPIGHDQSGLCLEFFRPLFEADRIHDALALNAAQSSLDDLPLRRIDHHRYARDVGFASDEVEEFRHRGRAIKHALIHVDIDDLGPRINLLTSHS